VDGTISLAGRWPVVIGASGGRDTIQDAADLHGWPSSFRMYYGPEFIADDVRTWCEARGITLAYIEPGKPNQNAYIERFNRSFREEVLDAWVFTTLAEVRAVSEEWRNGYNTERSHESLGNVPPLTFLPRPTNATPSTFKLCA
jgi:putative transposase